MRERAYILVNDDGSDSITSIQAHMDHFPTNWGKPRDQNIDAYNTYPLHSRQKVDNFSAGVQRTQQPVVTGTSVIALQYKDGIMMAADNLASYGSLARFKDVERLYKVGDNTILGASGDMSDFQYTKNLLDSLMRDQYELDDGNTLGTANIYEYLSRVMYNRRTKMNPIWNSFVVGGFNKGKKWADRKTLIQANCRFLGYVDLLGTTYQSPTIATGFGAHLAQPLLRKAIEGGKQDSLTEEEALKIIETCMRTLFYRDARSLNKFQVARITKEGAVISEPRSVDTNWSFAEFIKGYGA